MVRTGWARERVVISDENLEISERRRMGDDLQPKIREKCRLPEHRAGVTVEGQKTLVFIENIDAVEGRPLQIASSCFGKPAADRHGCKFGGEWFLVTWLILFGRELVRA